jgi:NAD-dependent deacetylase
VLKAESLFFRGPAGAGTAITSWQTLMPGSAIQCWCGNTILIGVRVPAAPSHPAHIALAQWGKELGGDSLFLCTQNVDELHEAAGSVNVVHIHGKLFESRCAAECGHPTFADAKSYLPAELPHCSCGALLRPSVCWFGEQPYHLDRIYQELETCRIFVAIGTSGSVQPVASFVDVLKHRHTPPATIYVGLDAPANASSFDQIHLGHASQIVPQVLSSLTKLL